MAQTIWSGVVSFGLLHVPVRLMPAERRHDLQFRLLDSRDNSPIRYERVNRETGEEVPWKDVVKAYEHRNGDFIVLSAEDLGAAAAEASQSVDIEAFVSVADIAPMYFDKPYFLVPAKKGEKAYVLLRETLRDSGYAALARVVIRTRQHLALVLPVGPAMVLNLIRFQQELIDIDDYAFPQGRLRDYRITPKERQMARQLIDSMAVAWQPDQYTDETRARLRKLIESRLKHGGHKARAKPAPAGETPTKVVDFIAVLKKSLDSNRRTPAATSVRKAARRKPASGKRRASRG